MTFSTPVEHIRSLKGALSHGSLFLGIVLYTALGAKIFQLLERPEDVSRISGQQTELLRGRQLLLHTICNSTVERSSREFVIQLDSALTEYEETCRKAAAQGVDLVTKDISFNWDYVQACFFSLSIITTIGYGNVATKTVGGRVFCLLFGIVGIPFMLSVLADVGGILAGLMQVTWGSNKEHALELAERMGILRTRKIVEQTQELSALMLIGAIVAFVLFLSLGALLFVIWEDWSFFESFYFCFITMTTIGFGDLTPSVSDKAFYMVLYTLYIMIGLAFTSTIIELVRRQYTESWNRIVELRAQIQAQLRLADTLKKISETAAKHNVDLGLNISDELKDLKENLEAYRAAGVGDEFDDVEVEHLDDKKNKAFLIYETSL